MAERGRPPFPMQRGVRFGGPRPNMPNTAANLRRPLLFAPPAAPPRFPPPRGVEPQYGGYHGDPRLFNPGPGFSRGPPPPPGPARPPLHRGGAEMIRPRFPCPRLRHPQPSVPLPVMDHGPLPAPPPFAPPPGEAFPPRFQPPLRPGFRPTHRPRFTEEGIRGDIPRPGVIRGDFTPRPDDHFARPRRNFMPRDPFGPMTRPPGPQDRPPVRFRPPQLEMSESNVGFPGARLHQEEPFGGEVDGERWQHSDQDWIEWSGEYDDSAELDWSAGVHHETLGVASESGGMPPAELSYGAGGMPPAELSYGAGEVARPHGNVQYAGRNRPPMDNHGDHRQDQQPISARARPPISVQKQGDWPVQDESKGSMDQNWTQQEVVTNYGDRFQVPDSSHSDRRSASSSGRNVRGGSPEKGRDSQRELERRKHEPRKDNARPEGRRGQATKRPGSHLDRSPSPVPQKRERLPTDRHSRDRSGQDRENRTSDSQLVRRRSREEAGDSRRSEFRRSSVTDSKSVTDLNSMNDGRTTTERSNDRNRQSSQSQSRRHRSMESREGDGSRGSREGDQSKGSRDGDGSRGSREGDRSRTSREGDGPRGPREGSAAASPFKQRIDDSTRNIAGRREDRSSSANRRARNQVQRPNEDRDAEPVSSDGKNLDLSRVSRRPLLSRQSSSAERGLDFYDDPLKIVNQQDALELTFQDPGNDKDGKETKKEVEKEPEEHIPDWIRCSPADLYFRRDRTTGVLASTNRMQELEKKIDNELLCRAERVRASRPQIELPPRSACEIDDHLSDNDSLSNMSLSEIEDLADVGVEDENRKNENDEQDSHWVEEMNWKRNHPERLHEEMWFNLPGEMNDGPLCRCSAKFKGQGIRHSIYPGEEPMAKCDPCTNNQDKLFHYRITMSPHTNFLTKNPTLIEYDNHEYIFEGFSIFSHYKIGKIPLCKVIRFNIEYTIHWFEEDMIENFDIRSLDLFADFLYREILELIDLDWAGKPEPDRCRPFHIMPRFARDLPDNGKEILSMSEVLNYLWRSSRPLLEETELANMLTLDDNEWHNMVDEVRGMIVTYPGMRPSSLRIDQLDREQKDPNVITYPKIIHFGLRPAQLSYAGDPKYKKLWKHYMKLKHLVANKPKASVNDREKMRTIEDQLQEIRLKGSMKREMTVEISSEGFIRSGIKSDICQHALLLPVLVQHLRFHRCLDVLERNIQYEFSDRLHLELALTHPSYRTNYGTNPDHARNSLTNCGFRQLEYGDRQIHYIHRRKRGINVLMHIMSKLAKESETPSDIHHYERLEFLGDSVIEFLSSIHLFFMFPRLEEGGLATYRAALVQNQFLTVLAEKIGLQHFMLYAHGPDLCRDLDLRYAMANCFEALMGSLFLDGGVEVVDRVYGNALFKGEPDLIHVWTNLPRHPLQEDEPNGDRHWIPLSPPLQKLTEFERMTGIVFRHIRLLARAFTMRNIGFNNLTLGHNQTLEFLGDTILQFISSEYLFKHFPDHHEGHLTLLRTSLVNHRTQATICDDLGMTDYVINNDQKVRERMENEKNKVKDKADILEAFLGALYVDQGLESCKVLAEVCFYPRLREFIMNQDWNDAKSQLQQCCLTLRDPSDGDPDIPIYKVLQCTGPTNTRKYHVAVYFRGERLGTGIGHSIQRAEMNAAANALEEKQDMFPHLLHVQHFLDRRFGKRRKPTHEHPRNPHHRHHHHQSKNVGGSHHQPKNAGGGHHQPKNAGAATQNQPKNTGGSSTGNNRTGRGVRSPPRPHNRSGKRSSSPSQSRPPQKSSNYQRAHRSGDKPLSSK